MTNITRRNILAASATSVLPGCAHWIDTGNRQVDAYLFCFSLYEFARTGWAAAAPNASRAIPAYNRVAHRRVLSDHTHRAITAPNADTIYSSSRLDLSVGPALVEIPSVKDRYFSVAFMNAATDNFAYVGTRATNGEGGRFLIAGPDWSDLAPTGANVIRSESADVWMLARIAVRDEGDLAPANAIQDQIAIVSAEQPRLLSVDPSVGEGPEYVLGVANAVLARMAANGAIAQRGRTFAAFGVEAGATQAWVRLGEIDRQAWREAAREAQMLMRDGGAVWAETAAGWRYPVGSIGSRGASDAVRASIALSGLGALEREEAAYARADADSVGEALDGCRAYSIVLPANVPVQAFWSLSLYQREADGRLFFSENAIGRYSISDRTQGLVRNADGAIPIALQRYQPAGAVNWLPTPEGPISLMFRAYLPMETLGANGWQLPGVVKASG
jgi:hypothetical protein